MRYIFKNIRQFICQNSLMFVLFIISQVFSVLVLLLSYGIYMNYREKSNQDIINTNGMYDEYGEPISENDWHYLMYYMDFSNYIENPKTFGEAKGSYLKIVDYLGEKLDTLNFELCSHKVTQEEADALKGVNLSGKTLRFCYSITKKNGEYSFQDTNTFGVYEKQGNLAEGRWITDEEIRNGDKVCVANPEYFASYDNPDPDLSGEILYDLYDDPDIKIETSGEDKYLNIRGTKYKIVGSENPHFNDTVFLPFFSTPDDFYCGSYFEIKLTKPLTVDEYNGFVDLFEECFGDMIDGDIPEMAMVNVDTQYFYNTNMWISVVIALAAAVNIAALFKYILSTRRKTLAIFKLTGATRGKIRRMYVTEVAVISIVVFLACTVIFRFLLLPTLVKYYPYVEDKYTLKVYGTMFLIYIALVIVTLNILVARYIRKTPVSLLKEG